MNLSCQNRRFVNDQSESKLYEWAEIESFINEQKSKICEVSSWIEDFVNKSCQNRWFLAENFKIEVIKEWYWLKTSSFESFKIEIEEKRKILVWEFQDRNQRKTNSSSWQCEMFEWWRRERVLTENRSWSTETSIDDKIWTEKTLHSKIWSDQNLRDKIVLALYSARCVNQKAMLSVVMKRGKNSWEWWE
jgi:hypothetical protein